jgi:hypothetical protein
MLLSPLIEEWNLRNLLLSSEFENSRAAEGNYLKKNYMFATLFCANRTNIVGFEVLTPVTAKVTVCWVVTSLVFQLFIDVSEEPAVSIIRDKWKHLSLWLWLVTT